MNNLHIRRHIEISAYNLIKREEVLIIAHDMNYNFVLEVYNSVNSYKLDFIRDELSPLENRELVVRRLLEKNNLSCKSLNYLGNWIDKEEASSQVHIYHVLVDWYYLSQNLITLDKKQIEYYIEKGIISRKSSISAFYRYNVTR